MTGEEYARTYAWGNDPRRNGDYDAASPCKHYDLPQTILEPILVRQATLNGFTCRYDTTFLSFTREPSGTVLSKTKDKVIGFTYNIRSKYLFGCDGARSPVLKQLEIPLIRKPGQGLAVNVLVKVDLSPFVSTRMGNLHWVMQPEDQFPDFGWAAVVRMVKPWNEWMFILFPTPGTGVDFETPHEEYLRRVRELVGDDSIPAEIVQVSKWYINEIVAEYYSKDNIFCLGDAVHRHPPLNGLGSNTCIEDAYNLAWKIAYVSKGKAGPSILDSYSLERQPVGLAVITRANQGFRDHMPVWDALGMMEGNLEKRKEAFAELSEASPKGAARREKLQVGVAGTEHEFHAVGIEMNQRYESSAVYLLDEAPRPPLPEDPVLEHEITTYPGSRLPHAWLNTRTPGKQFSTIDLAGHGAFCLFTGIGGEKWKDAALEVAQELQVQVNAYAIGWRQDYEDVYFDWARRREIAEDGCILTRPDRFVAWRSASMVPACKEILLNVMKSILSR
ncbi:MAG: FAD NAD(P)-binding [Lasallia pustulata]|uniref:FAD NAD(P)-binding n=1 Tax=Lasallia pustulata TaxID=136370 RepID=A0A5M8PVM4_9LECA|nr:MAG: FAD NAD(P)-binding [Lasallia pustulata]